MGKIVRIRTEYRTTPDGIKHKAETRTKKAGRREQRGMRGKGRTIDFRMVAILVRKQVMVNQEQNREQRNREHRNMAAIPLFPSFLTSSAYLPLYFCPTKVPLLLCTRNPWFFHFRNQITPHYHSVCHICLSFACHICLAFSHITAQRAHFTSKCANL